MFVFARLSSSNSIGNLIEIVSFLFFYQQLNNLDKLSHLVCNECVRKIENFHCYAMMAHKNQELFSIMYSEKIYREHCTALSSLNTTLYREPPTAPVQPAQPKSPNTITIQPTPPIKKQKVHHPPPSQPQPQTNKPIKLPPTTVITPAPPQPIQQQQPLQQPHHNSQQQVDPLIPNAANKIYLCCIFY